MEVSATDLLQMTFRYRLEYKYTKDGHHWHMECLNKTHVYEPNTNGWFMIDETQDEFVQTAFMNTVDRLYKGRNLLTVLQMKAKWNEYLSFAKELEKQKKIFQSIREKR